VTQAITTLKDAMAEIRRLGVRMLAMEIHLKRALKVCEKYECVDEACTCPGWHQRDTEAARRVLEDKL